MFRMQSKKRSVVILLMVAVLASLLVSAAFLSDAFSKPLPSFTVPCTITSFGSAWDGEFAFGLFQYNPANLTQAVASYLVVMDTNGNLVNLQESAGSNYFGSVNLIASDTLLYQGANGAVHFWNLSSGAVTDFPNVTGHHDVEYNPVNNTFLTLNNYVREVDGTNYLFDKIVEFDASGNILWTWDTYDHIPLSEQSIYNLTWPVNGQQVLDFTHANSLQWDFNNGVVYLNCRHTNTFYKINETSGDIIWACGEFGNFTLLDKQGNKVSSLWFGSHDLREVSPDVFIMFNNDFGNVTNFNDDHSSMEEVTLNEQNMTAQVTWNWVAPKELYSAYWGETALLPNGDRIGVFGTQTHPLATTTPYLVNGTGAVLVEVNPAGNVVRLYEFPVGWGIYRIEHISVSAAPTQPDSGTFSVPLTTVYIVAGVAAVICVVSAFAIRHQRRSRHSNGSQ